MYKLSVELDFSSAHNLRDYQGKCENLHGHNWKVRLKVSSDKLDSQGMVCDFTLLKKILKEILEQVDHKYLNEISPFDEINPTTENIARWVTEQVEPRLPSGVSVSMVTVWESEKCRLKDL